MNAHNANRARPAREQTGGIASGGFYRHVWVCLTMATLGAAGTLAQGGAVCPEHKALTLEKVAGYIEAKVPEERTVQRIESCEVSFEMNAQALDRLSELGVSEKVLDAINNVTASRLALDEARDEVFELEQGIEENDKAVNAERDAALQKLDAEYRVQRQSAGHVDPRGQFESNRDYNARLQQNQDALTAMDRKHDGDRDQLKSKFLDEAAARNEPFRRRITFLQRYIYPDARSVTFVNYDPDTGLLSTQLGGEEYLFDQVPSKIAETLYKNWKDVKAGQPLIEDELRGRVLVLEAASIKLPGYSRKAKEDQVRRQTDAKVEGMLNEARARVGRHDYDGAVSEYQSVLALNANNREAAGGIAAIQAFRQHQADSITEQRTAGEWVDPRTRLMWTLNDNGADISWNETRRYCQTLRIGGFSNWRVPSLGELESVFDRGATRTASKISANLREMHVFQPDNGRAPLDYHIAGGILLTTPYIWAMEMDFSRGHPYRKFFRFKEGQWDSSPPGENGLHRALCVR